MMFYLYTGFLKSFFLIGIFTVQNKISSYIFFCFTSMSNLCLATKNGVSLSNGSVPIPLTNITEKISNNNTIFSQFFYFVIFVCRMPLQCLMTAVNVGSWEGEHRLTLHFPPPCAPFKCKGKCCHGLSCVTLLQPLQGCCHR